ncbi:MAG: hypothetical protein ACJ745_16710, partial [Actinomycetes bacterium]
MLAPALAALAEPARLRHEVARLDLKLETLAEAHTATRARAVRPWAAGAAGAVGVDAVRPSGYTGAGRPGPGQG